MAENLFQVVSAPANWFMTLLTESNTLHLFVSVVMFLLIYRFLVLPLTKQSYKIPIGKFMTDNKDNNNRTVLYQNSWYTENKQLYLVNMNHK